MFTLVAVIDIKIALGISALVLTILGFTYKVHRDSLDKPKVRITASGAVAGFPGCRHYIVVQLTNSGRRPVTLASVRFQSAESLGLLVTHPDDPIFDAATCFPAKKSLKEGEQTNVYLPHNEFAEACPSPVKRFLALDTTGKTWKSKPYPLGKSLIKPILPDSE